jgi:hypothetical protein
MLKIGQIENFQRFSVLSFVRISAFQLFSISAFCLCQLFGVIGGLRVVAAGLGSEVSSESHLKFEI